MLKVRSGHYSYSGSTKVVSSYNLKTKIM